MKQHSSIPALRFPEFDHDWIKKPFKKVFKVGSGKDYKHLQSGNVPVYGTGGLMTHVNDYLYEGESVCIGRKGTIDNPRFINGKFWTVDTLFYTHQFDNVIPYFVYLIFQTINWKKHNEASGVPSLSKTTIENIKKHFPDKPEQEKIAAFLGAVDEKITQLSKKKDLLEDYKKGMMQKIFSQEIRFKDDKGNNFPDWKKSHLGKYIEEYKEKSTYQNEYEVFTSSRNGLMKQSDYYASDRITDRDNKGFNIIPPNFMTYRSRSDDRKFFFNINDLEITGIISTYYPVFRIKNGNNYFFKMLFDVQTNYIGKFSVGTSQTVLSMSELKKIKFQIPHPDEQQKISDFLSSLDQKIDATDKQLKAAQDFKKGLLQQMFV